ncbi:hypothetical protein O0I10_009015 [Lichtheimia ornata]|uniref:C2H2-type domain-containing protein n=1 Tax=Lichtheimia ornata TaxID=688661 RepID=A0AAD7XWG0_9FUNG|nr:uncharacterized protein O0I10_009015 [Lichtheimia ornata]KAJ8655326.1 hypothetical protein O0I10_009015 [Lichtheimia ornata]
MASSNGQQQEAPELAMFNPSSEPDRAVSLNVQQQQQQQLPDAAHNHLLQQHNAISFSTVSQANMAAPSASMYSDSMIMAQAPPHTDGIVDPSFAWVNDMLQGNVQDNPFNTTFNQQGQQQQQQQQPDQQMFMQTMIQTHPTSSAPQSIAPPPPPTAVSSNMHHVDQSSFTSQPTPTTSASIIMDTPNKKRRTMPASQPNTDHQDLRINSLGNEQRTNAADQLSNASTTPEGTLSPATPSLLAIDEKNQRRPPSRRPPIHHTVSAPSTSTDISNVGATITSNITTTTTAAAAATTNTTTTTNTTAAATSSLSCPKEYASMTRQELIARLVELEQEKRTSSLQSSPVTPEPDTAAQQRSNDQGRQQETDHEESSNEEIKCLWKDCGQEFNQVHELTSHLRDVHVGSGKPNYRCEWIGCPRNDKPFMKRHKMHTHLRTHTGERPFVCSHPGCTKRFPRPDSLTTHIKTHATSRPHICSFPGCEKAYLHVRSLKKHEQSHKPPYSIAGTMPVASYPTSMHSSQQQQPLPAPSPPDSIQQQQQQQHTPSFVPITQSSFIDQHTNGQLQM